MSNFLKTRNALLCEFLYGEQIISKLFVEINSKRKVEVMQKNKVVSLDLLTSEINPQHSFQSAAIINNRLEALKVLSNSLLYELQALQVNEESVKNGKIDLTDEVHRFEADLIRTALLRTGGRQRKAARLLNVKVTTLNAKIKRLGIEPQSINGNV